MIYVYIYSGDNIHFSKKKIHSTQSIFPMFLGYPYPIYNAEDREPVFNVVGRTIIALLAVSMFCCCFCL